MLLATTARSRGPSGAKALYRAILRTHKKCLPPLLRQLGDTYVQSEFRQHMSVEKKEFIDQFFHQWESYLEQILRTARAKEAAAAGTAVFDPTSTPPTVVGDLAPKKESTDTSSSSFSFGKEIPADVELSDTQKQQLEKLKEEAAKYGSGSR